MSQSATPTQSEFLLEEFNTSVTEETTMQLAQKIEEIVRLFQQAIQAAYLSTSQIRFKDWSEIEKLASDCDDIDIAEVESAND